MPQDAKIRHHNQISLVVGLDQAFYTSFDERPTGTDDILTRILNTQTWYEFETGKISQDQTYAQTAEYFQVDTTDVQAAVTRLVNTFSITAEISELLRSLKPGRKIYAMLNMPVSIWNLIKLQKADGLELFDEVFISGAVGHRKPGLAFFRHVIQETGANPESAIFIGALFENLVAAHSLGFKTIRYKSFADLERLLHNRCGDPVARANAYLVKHAKNHRTHASIDNDLIINENFTQLMLLEATNDPSLVRLPSYEAEWNFFEGCAQLTSETYPDDLDTTSMAWTVLPNLVDQNVKNRVMDRMLEFLDDEGIPLIYFDKNRPRRDHGICANIVTLFFANGRGQQLDKALNFLESLLATGAYIEGSRYYRAPEIFLYFMLRLFERAPHLNQIGELLKKRCQERIGFFQGDNPVALAMRLHCCNRLGVDARIDFERLLDMQQLDGSWDGGQIFYYGMRDVYMSNRGLTTGIAQRAIKEYIVNFPLGSRLEHTKRNLDIAIVKIQVDVKQSFEQLDNAIRSSGRSRNFEL